RQRVRRRAKCRGLRWSKPGLLDQEHDRRRPRVPDPLYRLVVVLQMRQSLPRCSWELTCNHLHLHQDVAAVFGEAARSVATVGTGDMWELKRCLFDDGLDSLIKGLAQG